MATWPIALGLAKISNVFTVTTYVMELIHDYMTLYKVPRYVDSKSKMNVTRFKIRRIKCFSSKLQT
jgi:hypothetical protein